MDGRGLLGGSGGYVRQRAGHGNNRLGGTGGGGRVPSKGPYSQINSMNVRNHGPNSGVVGGNNTAGGGTRSTMNNGPHGHVHGSSGGPHHNNALGGGQRGHIRQQQQQILVNGGNGPHDERTFKKNPNQNGIPQQQTNQQQHYLKSSQSMQQQKAPSYRSSHPAQQPQQQHRQQQQQQQPHQNSVNKNHLIRHQQGQSRSDQPPQHRGGGHYGNPRHPSGHPNGHPSGHPSGAGGGGYMNNGGPQQQQPQQQLNNNPTTTTGGSLGNKNTNSTAALNSDRNRLDNNVVLTKTSPSSATNLNYPPLIAKNPAAGATSDQLQQEMRKQHHPRLSHQQQQSHHQHQQSHQQHQRGGASHHHSHRGNARQQQHQTTQQHVVGRMIPNKHHNNNNQQSSQFHRHQEQQQQQGGGGGGSEQQSNSSLSSSSSSSNSSGGGVSNLGIPGIGGSGVPPGSRLAVNLSTTSTGSSLSSSTTSTTGGGGGASPPVIMNDLPPLVSRPLFYNYGGKPIEIRNVWCYNLEQEMSKIREILASGRYRYVAIDTEFPGVVSKPLGPFYSASEKNYELLRSNVNVLSLIQLGLAFADSSGNLVPNCPCWQFNFRFDEETQLHNEVSLRLLKKSGVDFSLLKNHGIDERDFAQYLMTSGLVLGGMENLHWISFHAGFDFGYLLKLLTQKPLPSKRLDFYRLFHAYFPNVYDEKFIINCEAAAMKKDSTNKNNTASSSSKKKIGNGTLGGGGSGAPAAAAVAPAENQKANNGSNSTTVRSGVTGDGLTLSGYWGLNRLGASLGIRRIGTAHQAGSDSLLTLEIWFQLCSRHFGVNRATVGFTDPSQHQSQISHSTTTSVASTSSGLVADKRQRMLKLREIDQRERDRLGAFKGFLFGL